MNFVISNFRGLLYRYKFLIFLLFILLYRLYYFDFFLVPNTDFFAFRARALDWLELSMPGSFKRAPLFPFLIGWFSLLFPVRHPILFTAEVLNLCLYPVSLFLIYSISKQFLKKGAFFVPWLFALNPLVYLSNQPILEVFFLTTILWTIYLDLRGSRLAYLAAALSSITRYEAVLLIPGLAIKDILFRPDRSKTLLLTTFSFIPIGVWMGLSAMHSPFLNPYISEVLQIGLDRDMAFAHTILHSLVGIIEDPFPLIVVAIILGVVGLVSLIKDSFKRAIPFLFFTFGYIVIHLFYPFNFPRFAFPILWVLQILVVRGIEDVFLLLDKKSFQEISPSSVLLWQLPCSILMGSAGAYILRESISSLLIYIGFFVSAFFGVTSIGGLMGKRRAILSTILLIFLSFFAIENIVATTRVQEWIKYRQAHWKGIGEWYNLNAKEGDKMALTLPSHVRFYTDLSEDHFVSLRSFEANSFEEFMAELKRREITYVVWDSTYGLSPHDPYGFKSHLIFELRDGKDRLNLKKVAFINPCPPWIFPPQYAIIYGFIH